MSDFIKTLILVVIGGSLLKLVVPKSSLGKSVVFVISLFVAIGVIGAFLTLPDQISAEDFPDEETASSVADFEQYYKQNIEISIKSQIESLFYAEKNVYPEDISIQSHFEDGTMCIDAVLIQTDIHDEDFLETLKQTCGMDCIDYDE